MTRSRADSVEGGDLSSIHAISLQCLGEKIFSSIIAKEA